MEYFASDAAERWRSRVGAMVAGLPSDLDDRAEGAAAASLRDLLDQPGVTEKITLAMQSFSLARRSAPSFRQGDFRALAERAVAMREEAFAMSAVYADAFGALARTGRPVADLDNATTSEAFGAALDALDRLAIALTGAQGSILAAVGDDEGGPAITAHPIRAIDVLAQGLAQVWIGSGRSLAGRGDGKLFAVILRVAHEALTGETDIKSEDRVLNRVRAWAKPARTP